MITPTCQAQSEFDQALPVQLLLVETLALRRFGSTISRHDHIASVTNDIIGQW